MKTLVLISEYFNVSIDYLLGTTSTPSPCTTASSLSSREMELLKYFNQVHNSSSLSLEEKKKVTSFFPFASIVQGEEKDLLEFYNELSLNDRRWIMGQMIDLIRKADEKASGIPKAQ